jgi:hypothetical protein
MVAAEVGDAELAAFLRLEHLIGRPGRCPQVHRQLLHDPERQAHLAPARPARARSGVFVRRRPVVIRSARNRLTREFRETGKGACDVEMKALGRMPRAELVELGPVVPPAEVADRLGLEPGEQALIRRRRMYADDEPMQLATSLCPGPWPKARR